VDLSNNLKAADDSSDQFVLLCPEHLTLASSGMLSRLTKFLTGATQDSHPSTVLTLEAFPEVRALHVVPEDGTVELISYSKDKQFRYGGAKEQSREQLGAVSLQVGGGETLRTILDNVILRVEKDLSLRDQTSNGGYSVDAVSQALRSAALSVAHERTEQESTATSAQSYPIFLVQIDRAKPGKIIGEPRSISKW
jgi:hypothetical protein